MNDFNAPSDNDFDPTAIAWNIPRVQEATVPPAQGSSPFGPSRTEQLHSLSLQLHRPEMNDYMEPARAAPESKRQFTRCPVVVGRTNGMLKVDGRRMDCEVVEMSIGGFGVIVTGEPRFQCGSVGRLRARGLNYVVSVSRIEKRDNGIYIGLKQLQEVIEPNDKPSTSSTVACLLVAGLSGALIAAMASYFMQHV